jgi:hypothetical protein
MALTRIGLNQSINLASNVTGTLPTGNGGTGATSFAPGKILQVVTNTHATRFETSSTSFVAATGYDIAITPSSSSNKVFVMISTILDNKASGRLAYATLYRTISGGSATDIIDDAEGIAVGYSAGARVYTPTTLSALDSPNTTSAVTYQVYVKNYNGEIGINGPEAETQLTAFEIAG